MTDCQAEAESDIEGTDDAIDCSEEVCEGSGINKRAKPKKPCHRNVPPDFAPGEEGKCLGTFKCDTDSWPNVCNNAKSAIEKRGASSVLTVRRKGVHDTGRYYDLHGILSGSRDTRNEGPNINAKRDGGWRRTEGDPPDLNAGYPAMGGWGLVGKFEAIFGLIVLIFVIRRLSS